MNVLKITYMSQMRSSSFFRGALISILVTACATTEKAVETKTPDHLVVGVEHRAAPALGDYYPVSLETKSHAGEVTQTLRFKGWDFNGDGKIDMLEVLSDKGEVVERLYDFDFDGKIDQREILRISGDSSAGFVAVVDAAHESTGSASDNKASFNQAIKDREER